MSKAQKRKNTTKYSELEAHEVDEDAVNKVLNKTKD